MKRPISVVRTDQEALCLLLAIHAVEEPRILDVTHNQGRMWRGLPYRPHRADSNVDLHAAGHTDTVADFRHLPFADASWDVVVFDPPHVTEAGRSGIVGDRRDHGWADAYGTLSDGLDGASIAPLFVPFLQEARRVLVPGTGVVLAKIADQVHRNAYRWQHVDLVVAAQEMGFTPCDLVVKVALSRGGLIDPRWRSVFHVRGVHTFWLALRNGGSCVRPTRRANLWLFDGGREGVA